MLLSHLCYLEEIHRRGDTQQGMTVIQDITTIITGNTTILRSRRSLVKQARGRGREREGTMMGYRMKQELEGNQLVVTQQAAERKVQEYTLIKTA